VWQWFVASLCSRPGDSPPCLSSAVGGLIERYTEVSPDTEIIAYQYGYHGLLTGTHVVIDEEARQKAGSLHRFGGSPIGNSRVKLTNVRNLVSRGLVKDGQDPLEVAAERLREDGVDVLHTIGGDDTNTTAADLAAYLAGNDYQLTVVGLPKTIDNDIVPIRQSLGADTAAEEAAEFAQNIIGEHRANPRMLIVHEVMGRNCGWLTAAAVRKYRGWLDTQEWGAVRRAVTRALGRPRGLRARDGAQPRHRGVAAPGDHGRDRQREHLPLGGCWRTRDHRRDGAGR
jgi:pyrophosphate-dependent phosphofructokinase (EC 2.7.1.90)